MDASPNTRDFVTRRIEAITRPEATDSTKNTCGPIAIERDRQRATAVRVISDASSSNRPHDISLEDQMIAMAEFISSQEDWVSVGVFNETKSGKRMRERPAFQQVEHAMRTDQVDVVLVTEASCWSRKHSELAQFIDLAERCGVQVWTTTGQIPYMTAMALWMVAGLGLEDKTRQIARRHKAMNKDGRHVGPRPYGYRLVRRAGQSGYLEVDVEEARIVGLIYRSYLDGTSLPGIVEKLNETSVPPPRGDKWKVTILSQDGVSGILHDTIYMGLVVCGMYETFEDHFTGARRRVPKPPAEWSIAQGQHEPIVPIEIFGAVQKRYADERSAT